MYGIHRRQAPKGSVTLNAKVGANSEVFAVGDPVTTDADGFLIVATAGARVQGRCNAAYTMASDNETVGRVKVEFEECDYRVKFEADMSAAVTDTNRGQYCDLTGTTGAVLMDFGTVNDNTGSFRIDELDPRGEGSTVRVLVSIAEPEHLAYTQN